MQRAAEKVTNDLGEGGIVLVSRRRSERTTLTVTVRIHVSHAPSKSGDHFAMTADGIELERE